MATTFDTTTAQSLLDELFAPWIVELDLKIEAIGDGEVTMRLPYADRLCRADKVVCGQALMALIDTCAVFVSWSAIGVRRNVTTVNQTTSFMRAAVGKDVIARGRTLKAGRTMVFMEVSLSADGDDRLIGHGTSTFAVLPGSIAEPPA